ncbi:glycosyltransferase [Moraxella nasicaprae]|uniref:Glycosyltransferase n=1 Tax=Moraxella nasicaprae TaxID=2904122 RepID=A0ABY6F4J7_9GAMM|nr:glycosyltransferase [Moraxella nasicaprae]UXZ04973.1 glycosyltransferase [Moraxella nasicaprae]
MIDNKMLIFFPRPLNINAGGPSGFLAHNLSDKPRDCFVLSNDLMSKETFFEKQLYRIRRWIDKLNNPTDNHKEYFKIRDSFKKINASQYKYIYFHEDIDFYCVQDLIDKEQIVIYQPHTPQLHSEEFACYAPEHVEKINMIKKAEKAVFERADIVVLPNEYCQPIYQTLISPKNTFYYLLSGAKNNYDKPSSMIDLPQSTINLMYIGRRNEIKGFDIILDNFRKARKTRKDIHLFIIGNGEKIEEEGITDIGFSDKPLDWYHSVDYLLNANRQSYFDLSIIEALSTGVPIIMSHNFGHYYYQNKSPLITTYDITQPDALYRILNENLTKRDRTIHANRELYEQELTDVHYHIRLQQFFQYLNTFQSMNNHDE